MGGLARLEGKNLPIARRMLKEVTSILERRNIWYCLDGGTLLGIMREQRLLPWDNDMDLFVTADDYDKLRASMWNFRLRGYWAAIRRLKVDLPPLIAGEPRIAKIRNRRYHLWAGPVRLDIFIKHRIGENFCWSEGGLPKAVQKCVPARFFDQLTQTEFDGKKYWIPEKYDEYLTYRYNNWRTPRQGWDHLADDHAITLAKTTTP